jgi:hypothetical protein
VHSFYLELMLDFQPTSQVTHLSFSLTRHALHY